MLTLTKIWIIKHHRIYIYQRIFRTNVEHVKFYELFEWITVSVENHQKATNPITLNKQQSGLANSSNLSVFRNYQMTTNLITLNKQQSGLAKSSNLSVFGNYQKTTNLITLNKQQSGLSNSSNVSVFGNYQKTTNLITLNKQKSGLATKIWTCDIPQSNYHIKALTKLLAI